MADGAGAGATSSGRRYRDIVDDFTAILGGLYLLEGRIYPTVSADCYGGLRHDTCSR